MTIQELSRAEVLTFLRTSETGLSQAEAGQRLQEYGPNELSEAKKRPLYLRFLAQFSHFLALLLWVAALLCFISEYLLPGEGMITLGLAIILGLAVLSTVNALYQNLAVKYESGEVADSWIPAIENLGYMKDQLAEYHFAVSDRLSGRDTSSAEAFAQRLQTLQAQLAKATEVYAATLLTYTADNAAQGDAEKALYAAYQTRRDRYFELARAGVDGLAGADADRRQAAASAYAAQGPAAFADAYQAMQAILKFNLEGTAGAAQLVTAHVVGVERVMLLILGLVLLVGGALIWYLPQSVSRPLDRAAQATRHIADGDLSRDTPVDGRDEVNALIDKLNAMQASLAQVVGGVRQSAEAVASASAEIAQGNHDLSARTESQASALEQTAASMQELKGAVQHTAASARNASQLATEASSLATQGGQVVNDLVVAMTGISGASRQIADITSVIDSIAFQTNILALNAAVEAARAGEQGRGFAVVAGEVRTLAQRSAQAAREIRQLIDASVTQVEQGNQLAQNAGRSMGEAVQAIGRVTTIFSDISAASSEQSHSVAQVGEAVQHMDQSTQQNAALVEQMAAAASALQQQAHDLVAAVARFRLPGAA